MRRPLQRLVLPLSVVLLLPSAAPAADPTEQRRLELLGTLPREQQRAPANQAWLVAYVRRASSAYLHRLDSLGCRELFSLGDEARFAAAVGATGGLDLNAVFIEGDGNPRHEIDGAYVFPANTYTKYWPPRPDLDTYWHENQHALLDAAGVGVNPRPYGAAMDVATDTDDHHAFIEGVGQRGAEAYDELIAFEAAVRRADQVESEYTSQGRDVSDYGVQRQLWGDAHQRFSAFVRKMKRVANMPAGDLANYRSATGVFFSPVEAVAEWYRNGGLKRQERGEVLPLRPPAWVFFPDLSLMPVQIKLADAQGRDLELPGAVDAAPSETKNDVFRQTIVVRVRAKGSMSRWTKNTTKNREIAAEVARGTLRVRVVEDDPLAGLSIASGPSNQPLSGVAGPGGPSTRFFDVDLSKGEVLPLRVTFLRRQLSQLRAPTTYHVALEFSDPGKDRLYDSATAQLGFTLGVSGGGPKTSAGAPPPTAPPKATATATPAEPKRGEKLGVKAAWTLPSGVEAYTGGLATGNNAQLPSAGELELVSGPAMFFQRGSWAKEGGFFLELYARREDKNMVTLDDYLARVRPKDQSAPSIAWFERFKHRETKVGGLRAFESFTSGSAQQMNHHWFIELDPQRQLWVTLLGDCKVSSKNLDAFGDLVAAMEGTVKGLRFILAAAPPLAVSHADAPVPRAFTDAAIADNEIAKRPPPPPADPTGGRRKRPTVASATPPPGTSGTPPPRGPSPGNTTSTPPRNPAPPGGSAPPRTPPPPPSRRAPGTATRAPGSSTTTNPPPTAPAAPPPAQLSGRATVSSSSVTLINSGTVSWTKCTASIPGRRSQAFPPLPPRFQRELPFRKFAADGSAPDLVHEVLVRCAEGTLRLPAKL